MLDNGHYYTVKTTQQTYNNVLCLNYACLNGYSRFIYLQPLDELEVYIITSSIKNNDIKQIQEQEKFIFL